MNLKTLGFGPVKSRRYYTDLPLSGSLKTMSLLKRSVRFRWEKGLEAPVPNLHCLPVYP